MEDKHINSGDLILKAIGNAGGIPYRLTYGDQPEDSHFICNGDDILQLFGISPLLFTEKVLIDSTEEYIPLGNYMPENYGELREKILSGEFKETIAEILIKTPGGETKWIMDSSVPFMDDKTGKVTGLTGIFFDISEQKSILLQLEKARLRATESDRLKTAFLNNLSHEIRTPLNAIVGFTTLLGEPGMMSRRSEFMDIITHSSDHLLEIVDDILEISKIETKIVRLTLKKTNLNDMLLRIYNRFKTSAAAKNIQLSFYSHTVEEPVIITTDSFKLFQAFTRIVHNALKFTHEDGTVEFGFDLEDGRIQFFVSDSGIGIRPGTSASYL